MAVIVPLATMQGFWIVAIYTNVSYKYPSVFDGRTPSRYAAQCIKLRILRYLLLGLGITNLPRCDARHKRNGTRTRETESREKRKTYRLRVTVKYVSITIRPCGTFYTFFNDTCTIDYLWITNTKGEIWETRMKTRLF